MCVHVSHDYLDFLQKDIFVSKISRSTVYLYTGICVILQDSTIWKH